MKTLFVYILTLIIFSISAFAQDSSQHYDAKKLEEILNEYQINEDPGIAISVIQNGEIIYKRNKGYANLEHMVAITDSTKFVVGSISKQFAACAILLLEDEGKLSIDDDITKHLPELNELPHAITVKQLINHTSGFRNTDDLNSLRGRTDEDLTSQKEMVNLLLRQKGLNFIPGARFQYCNSGYVLLAEIVERVSGMRFSEFTKERIFDPLGMKHSLFLENPNLLVKNKALSYYKQDDAYWYIPLNRSVVGSTGLYTTVGDLCIWANNFDNPKIGSRSIFQKMKEKSSLNDGQHIPYALGQEVKVYKGLDVVFHGGGDAGFRSYLLRVPAHNLSIAISGNFEAFNPLNISYGLVDVFLSDYILEPSEISLPAYTNKDLKKFEGDYQVFPGLYITILAENDSLYFKSYGSDYKLRLPVLGENEFCFPDRPHSKLVFFQDSLHWHFSDFHYPGTKVTLDPPKYDTLNLTDFQGVYESIEVETAYAFEIKNHKLFATHPLNGEAELTPIEKDTFISNSFYLSRIAFTRDSHGNINACEISGQKSIDVLFQKQNR